MPDLLDGRRPRVAPDDPPSRRLQGFVDEVLAGSGRAVWIEGGPGSGKTGLLAPALAQARAGGSQVAGSSAAHQPGPRLRLNPIMECLGLDPTSRDLRRVLNAVPTQLVPQQRPATRGSGGMAAERLMAMFRQLCAAGPLVVAIDDLHLGDPASIRLWGRLIEQTEHWPLLLLATARPQPDRPHTARPQPDRPDLERVRATHNTSSGSTGPQLLRLPPIKINTQLYPGI